MRVIVTRPLAQAQPFVARLQALGVAAVALPLIGIEPAGDRAALEAAWAHLDGAALVMFVSPNAVLHFFEARPNHSPWPPTIRAGSTGPGTTAALLSAGVPPECVSAPDDVGPFDSEALWGRIQAWPWAGRRALVVRGEEGRDWLAEQLRQAGASVDFVAAYRRVPPVFSVPQQLLLQEALATPALHLWHFSSSQAIEHLLQAVVPFASAPASTFGSALASVLVPASAVATHPRIVDTARRLGFGQVTLVGVRPEDVAVHLQDQGRPGASIESSPL